MPPKGYTTITISDNLSEKITRIMARHDRSSYAEAIEYAVDEALAREEELTTRELVQMLSERVDSKR